MRTSLSCPFSCTFCNFPKYAGRYRLASLETVENEIRELNGLGNISGMWIIDDTYNFPPDRFKDVLRVMIKNKNKIKMYDTDSSAFDIVDNEIIFDFWDLDGFKVKLENIKSIVFEKFSEAMTIVHIKLNNSNTVMLHFNK
jgi:radical SAM superfamily enzyme YgiQ (UPF0313 family)